MSDRLIVGEVVLMVLPCSRVCKWAQNLSPGKHRLLYSALLFMGATVGSSLWLGEVGQQKSGNLEGFEKELLAP